MHVYVKIEGGHGLTFERNGVVEQLQNVVKDVMSPCGDNNILPKPPMRYFRAVIKRVNKA